MHVLTDLGMIYPVKARNFKSYGLDRRSICGRMKNGRVTAYTLLYRYRGDVGQRLLITYETRAYTVICCVWRVLSPKPKYDDRRPPSFDMVCVSSKETMKTLMNVIISFDLTRFLLCFSSRERVHEFNRQIGWKR